MTVTTDVVPSPKTFAGIPIAPVRETRANINILIYGLPGAGKTYLASLADNVPEMRPVLYLNIEGGDMTLRHSAPNIQKVPENGSISWPQIQDVYDTLHRQCYNAVEPGEFAPRTVILDTLTECQKMNMSQIMSELISSNPEGNWDPDIPQIKQWGKNIEQIRKWVRRFRDLPLNVIMTAHEKQEKNQMTGAVLTLPSLSGKLSNEVAGFFDIVAYLYVKKEITETQEGNVEKTVRKLLTGAWEGYVAKDRSGNLPEVIVNPTMRDIYSYVTEGIAYKEPTKQSTESVAA